MRIVLVEDSVLLREGLVRLLAEAGMTVAAAVGDAPSLLRAVAEHDPDLAIVDVRLPPTFTDEGLVAAIGLRRERPKLPLVVLSQVVEERHATDLLGGDARGLGYLLKDRVADMSDFIGSLRRVAAGGTALDPEVVRQVFARRRRRSPIEALTERERDVLALMAEGRSNAAIAARLDVSDGAVEKHVGNIFLKLGLAPDEADHRRVRAVVAWLTERG